MVTLLVHGSRTDHKSVSALCYTSTNLHILQSDQAVSGTNATLWQPQDVISRDTIARIDDFCRDFKRNWLAPCQPDPLQWDGVSLRVGLEGTVIWEMAIERLKTFAIAINLIKLISPSNVFIGHGTMLDAGVWRYLCTHHNISYDTLPIEVDRICEPEWEAPWLGNRRPVSVIPEIIATPFSVRLQAAFRRRISALWTRTITSGTAPRFNALMLPSHLEFKSEMNYLGLGELINNAVVNTSDLRQQLSGESVRDEREAALAEAKTHFARFWLEHRNSGLSQNLYFMDENVFPLFQEQLEDIVLNKLPDWCSQITALRKAMSVVKPDIVVGRETRGGENAVLASSLRREGVPVILVQTERRLPQTHRGFVQPESDVLLTLGPSSTESFVAEGFSEASLICVGSSLPSNRGATTRVKNLAAGYRKVVLYTDNMYNGSDGYEDAYDNWRRLGVLGDVATQFPDVLFLVKFHPGWHHKEDGHYIQRRVDFIRSWTRSNVRPVPLSITPFQLFPLISFVLSGWSSMGIEALCSCVPVMYWRNSDCDPEISDLRGLPGVISIDSDEELSEGISNLFNDLRKIRRTVRRNCRRFKSYFCGTSLPRARIIVDLLRKNFQKTTPSSKRQELLKSVAMGSGDTRGHVERIRTAVIEE